MKIDMEKDVYKIRSVSACLKAAAVLLRTNLKTVVKKLWLPALAIAIVKALIVTGSMHITEASVLHQPVSILASTATGLLTLLLLAAECWFFAWLFDSLNEHGKKWNTMRSAKIMVVVILLNLLFACFTGGLAIAFLHTKAAANMTIGQFYAGMFGGGLLLYLILLLALLPLVYFFTKYMMEKETSLRRGLWSELKPGYKHYGFLLSALLLAGFITVIIAWVVKMPDSILGYSYLSSLIGMSKGDPSGLPSYFNIIVFASGVITDFILCFVAAWNLFVSFYVYGSIEEKENAKTRLTDINFQQTTR